MGLVSASYSTIIVSVASVFKAVQSVLHCCCCCCCFDFLAISVSFDYLRQSLWQDSIFLLYFSSKSVRLFAGEKKVRIRTMAF